MSVTVPNAKAWLYDLGIRSASWRCICEDAGCKAKILKKEYWKSAETCGGTTIIKCIYPEKTVIRKMKLRLPAFQWYDIFIIREQCISAISSRKGCEPAKTETQFAKLIRITKDKARYDNQVKKLLANRAILAWILKTCTEEFAPYRIQEIEGCIRVNARTPFGGILIELIINIEVQLDPSPGYPIEKRDVYYCSCLISTQSGTTFAHSEYQKLQKVYIIWFCPDPLRK